MIFGSHQSEMPRGQGVAREFRDDSDHWDSAHPFDRIAHNRLVPFAVDVVQHDSRDG